MFKCKATAKCQTLHETIQRHHAYTPQAEEPVTSSSLLDTGTAFQTAGTGMGEGRGKVEQQVIFTQPLILNSTNTILFYRQNR